MRRLSERGREVAFGAGLLLSVVLALAVGEGLLRVKAARGGEGFDWVAFLDATAYENEGERFMRFRPGTSYEHVAFNAFGGRGPSLEDEPPADTLRIGFLGNSVFLGAELADGETIPAQVIADLSREIPSCRFERLTIAGPDYPLRGLAKLLDEVPKRSRPDFYVVIGAVVRDALIEYGEQAVPPRDYFPEAGFIGNHSMLAARILRKWIIESNERAAARRPLGERIDLPHYVTAYRDSLDSLASVIGDAPTVVMPAGGKVREGMTDEEVRLMVHRFASETRGIGSSDVLPLRRLIESETDAAATALGWTYIDPVAALPATAEYFIDPIHPSAEGARRVALAIAASVRNEIADRGGACGLARSGKRLVGHSG